MLRIGLAVLAAGLFVFLLVQIFAHGFGAFIASIIVGAFELIGRMFGALLGAV